MAMRDAVRTMRRITAIGVVVAVLGCTATEDPSPPNDAGQEASTSSPAPSVEPRTDGPATLDDEVVDAVTSAGIFVTDAAGAVTRPADPPAAGVGVTEEHLVSLVTQAESGAGTRGSDLDAVVPTPVPLSAFLVGYARGAQTPAAHLAADLLGDQDLTHPQEVVFPALVPLLFAADLAHAAGDPTEASMAPATYGLDTVCSDVSAEITRGINAVFDALHVDYVNLPKTGVTLLDDILQGMAKLVVDGINIVIEAGRWLVLQGEKYLIHEVLSIVAQAAAIATMVGKFLEWVSKIVTKITTDVAYPAKGTEPKGNPVVATLEARIDLGLGDLNDWPPWFKNCAEVAGAGPLPPLKPAGEAVTWLLDSPPNLLLDAGGHKDKELMDPGEGPAVASWALVTGTEPAGLEGEPDTYETATVTAVVHRTRVKALLLSLVAMGSQMLLGHLPPFVSVPLRAAVNSAAGSLLSKLLTVMDLTTVKPVPVAYHTDKPKPPKPVHEIWAGDWVNPGYGSAGTFTMDVRRTDSAMTGTLQVQGSDCIQAGQLEAKVDGDQVTFGLIQGGIAQITFQGVIEGKRVVGLWSVPKACGSWQGSWQATITKAGR